RRHTRSKRDWSSDVCSSDLWLDYLAKAPDFHRLLANRPCPLIATVRRASDGGRWPHSEDERRMLLRQAIVAGFDWVDLETDVAEIGRASCRERGESHVGAVT